MSQNYTRKKKRKKFSTNTSPNFVQKTTEICQKIKNKIKSLHRWLKTKKTKDSAATLKFNWVCRRSTSKIK
jgi:hypothetical protein